MRVIQAWNIHIFRKLKSSFSVTERCKRNFHCPVCDSHNISIDKPFTCHSYRDIKLRRIIHSEILKNSCYSRLSKVGNVQRRLCPSKSIVWNKKLGPSKEVLNWSCWSFNSIWRNVKTYDWGVVDECCLKIFWVRLMTVDSYFAF